MMCDTEAVNLCDPPLPAAAADQPCRNSARPSHHMTTASFTETPPDAGASTHYEMWYSEGGHRLPPTLLPGPPPASLLWAFRQNVQKNNEFPLRSHLNLSEILKLIMSLQEAVR